ncbi:MAG: hypothetical protein K2X81_11425, partial [Candidatus Obscuribacterales bacterium]|nr:hypothetical protein [Candidatus Obscuribacterales bacterium]
MKNTETEFHTNRDNRSAADRGSERHDSNNSEARFATSDRQPNSLGKPSEERNNKDAVRAGFSDGDLLLSQLGLLSGITKSKNDALSKTDELSRKPADAAQDMGKNGDSQPIQTREHKDHSKYVSLKREDGSGSIDHIGTGPTTGDNFKVRQTGDSYETLDKDNKTIERSSNPDVKQSREKLETLAKNFGDSEQRSRFFADISKLENRLKSDPKELAKTFSEVASMLENKDKTKIGPTLTERLASEVMSQAASPQSIDQGSNPTCSVTAVESIIYHDNPSIAAKAMRDIAETGEHQMRNGKMVSLNNEALKPNEPTDPTKRLDNERSLATKYMNSLLITTALERNSESPWFKEHGWTFEYKESAKEGSQIIVNRTNDSPLSQKFDGLSSEDQVYAYKMLTGAAGKKTLVIEHESMGAVDKEGKPRQVDGIATYSNQQQFNELTEKLKENHGFPVITTIDAKNRNFIADGCTFDTKSMIDASKTLPHALVIDDIYEDKASLNNQWGSKCDYDLPKSEVYSSSLRNNLQVTERARAGEASGKPDLEAEMDLKYRDLAAEFVKHEDPSAHKFAPLPEALKFLQQEISKAD